MPNHRDPEHPQRRAALRYWLDDDGALQSRIIPIVAWTLTEEAPTSRYTECYGVVAVEEVPAEPDCDGDYDMLEYVGPDGQPCGWGSADARPLSREDADAHALKVLNEEKKRRKQS